MFNSSPGLAALSLLAAVGSASVFGQARPEGPSSLLRLKSGHHYTGAGTRTSTTARRAVPAYSSHFIAVFHQVPNATDAQNLRELGFRVLAFVPDNGLMVYGNSAKDLSAFGVIEAYTLAAGDKLSPLLDRNAAGASTVIVAMQPDVDPGIVSMRLALAGATVLPNQDLNSTEYLVRATYATLQKLAGWDETAYIYPASEQLKSGQKITACSMGYSGGTSLGVAANLVPTFGDGWAGSAHGAAAISYSLHTSVLPLAESDVRSALQSVLAEWSAYAAITFSPTTAYGAAANIDIGFYSGAHGDGFPFSSSGNVLAHTFYPPPNPEPIAGDMHLNYDEGWSTNGDLQLYSVMLHEMGHALGLGHSDDPNDVMYPYYQATQHLAAGDIAALQTLYAAPIAEKPVTPTDPDTPDAPATPVTPPVPPATPNGPTAPTTPNQPDVPSKPPASPNNGDTTAPFVQIFSPAMSAILSYKDSIGLQGFATDNVGVTQIRWSNSAGGSGSASVSNPFVIAGIGLLPGVNRIQIQAIDAAGNIGSAYLTVTRK